MIRKWRHEIMNKFQSLLDRMFRYGFFAVVNPWPLLDRDVIYERPLRDVVDLNISFEVRVFAKNWKVILIQKVSNEKLD